MVPLRPDGNRGACWCEASCGTVSFHDADRLRTLARMPEAGKTTAQFAAEVAHVRKVRPDLPLVAVADTAPDNWTFLERLRPDERAIDFACEQIGEVAAVATDWYDRYRAVLRDRASTRSSAAISATRRQDRRSGFSTASSHSSARTGAAATRASKPRVTRWVSGGRPQGAPAHETGRHALVHRRRHPHLQGDVRPRRMAGDDWNACCEPSAGRHRGLTAENLISETKTGFYKNRSAPRRRELTASK